MFGLTGLRIPIIQAPMAGGPSTVALATAVRRPGGLGFLAAGYKTPHELAGQITALRAETAGPFGVNVFVPQRIPELSSISGYWNELAVEAGRYEVTLPEVDLSDDDYWDEKIALLNDHPVPVVSFTFDAASEAVIHDLHSAGSYIVVTVTSLFGARKAVAVGANALCVQGPEAGGHRGCSDLVGDPDATPLSVLLSTIDAEISVPLIAAGGVATGAGIAAV